MSFFVDDLDRLVPDKAVEVMEVLKMFLDCEHCVFLLAIDYEAVVNGVTIRYHNAISEEKGRDFFEKMIQVVYTLPDTMNHTDKYISDILISNNQNISLAYDFADLVKTGGKDNPRAIKRLLNSYFLLNMMKCKFYAQRQSQTEAVMQFAVLCLQAICPQMYDYLSDQFSGIYNYEKGVMWFNTLHKYVYEMSRLSNSTVEIKEEKLEQWQLLKADKRPDRVKLEFLCTFFDKMDSSLFAKNCPGKQIHIQDVLGLQNAIMWTNLVQGRDDTHTYLDNIARIEISYGGYKNVQESTTLGTIEEAYRLTVVHILQLLYKEGMPCLMILMILPQLNIRMNMIVNS